MLHKYAPHTYIYCAYEDLKKKKERERDSKEICQDTISSCLWLGLGVLEIISHVTVLNLLWFFMSAMHCFYNKKKNISYMEPVGFWPLICISWREKQTLMFLIMQGKEKGKSRITAKKAKPSPFSGALVIAQLCIHKGPLRKLEVMVMWVGFHLLKATWTELCPKSREKTPLK